MRTGRPSRFWILALSALAGCGLLRPGEGVAPGTPSAERVERLRSLVLDANTSGQQFADISQWMRISGMTPIAGGAAPLDARTFEVGGRGRQIGGFVPGRHPTLRSELVIVQVSLTSPDAAIAMEAAQVLVEKSRTENLPGRSILFVFTSETTEPLTARALWPSASIYGRAVLRGERTFDVVHPETGSVVASSIFRGESVVDHVGNLLDSVLRLASPQDTLFSPWIDASAPNAESVERH